MQILLREDAPINCQQARIEAIRVLAAKAREYACGYALCGDESAHARLMAATYYELALQHETFADILEDETLRRDKRRKRRTVRPC